MTPTPTAEELRAPFKAYRKDGWPLCPKCGEDELACIAYPLTLEEADEDARTADIDRRLLRRLREGMYCYKCRWTSPVYSRPPVVPIQPESDVPPWE